MKKSILYLFAFFLIFPAFSNTITFTGYVKTNQNIPLSNYKVFFRFTSPAYLPGNFYMNGPVIETDNNGKYTYTLVNVPSGIQYFAKIYVYDINFHRIEKAFAFSGNGCNYNVTTIYTTPYHPSNTFVDFESQNFCQDCPAAVYLNNTSSPNLLHSDFVHWKWTADNDMFSQLASSQFFISSPQMSTVELSAILTDPYTNYTFLNVSKTINLVNDSDFFFHLGGQIFSGSFPVNTSGVVLYRKINMNYEAADTMIVSNYGYYYFTNIPSCSYIIKVFPEPDQAKSDYYLPTYFPDASSWMSAANIHRTNATSTMTINLLLSVPLSGNGIISGNIFNPDMSPAFRCELLLYNSNLEPIQYQLSDDQGTYEFSGLPTGNYFLTYEIPGFLPVMNNITLTQAQPEANIDFIIGQTTQIQYSEKHLQSSVFPNPFNESLNILFSEVTQFGTKSITIRDINGSIVSTKNYVFSGHSLTMSLPFLVSGNYILEIYHEHQKTSEKFIIQKL